MKVEENNNNNERKGTKWPGDWWLLGDKREPPKPQELQEELTELAGVLKQAPLNLKLAKLPPILTFGSAPPESLQGPAKSGSIGTGCAYRATYERYFMQPQP